MGEEPQFVDREAFWVLGIGERIEPMSADYNALWQRYEARVAEAHATSGDAGCYGVYFPCEEAGRVDFIAGAAVTSEAPVAEGLVKREVPAAHYAVFECRVSSIGATWGRIFGAWLPASGYQADHSAPSFEYFPPAEERDHPCLIFQPVVAAG